MIGSLEIGGSQTFVMNIYRKINREKIQFDFIIDKEEPSPYTKEILKLGGRIFKLPTFKGMNVLKIKSAWNRFFIQHPEYHIIHFHVRSYTSLLIPIAKKYGLYTIQHSHSTSDANNGHSYIKKVLEFPLRFQADYMMACSNEAGQWLFGNSILKRDNYKTIKNAIDGEKFYFNPKVRKEVRQKLKIPDNCLVLGNVGRLTPQKNQKYVLKVFSETLKSYANSRLLLVGDGPLKNDLMNEAKNLKVQDKCLFVGARTDTNSLYQAMDIFLFPSLFEGLGIVAVEAQASGLPCIVSNKVPSFADIGADLYESLSIDEEIKKWVELVLKNKNKLRKNTKKELERSGYDISSSVNFFEKFYEKAYIK